MSSRSGSRTEGVKVPLGLWEGSTENATLARSLLVRPGRSGPGSWARRSCSCFDGGKALRKAIKEVFGEHALVHRCHRHKERNVLDLFPERDRPKVLARIRGAWALKDAKPPPDASSSELAIRTRPVMARRGRVAARRSGPETLTLMGLGITGQLAKTLSSTNPIESMIEIVRHTQRNVKRWQDGDMRKRWTAAGMLQAEQQFRRDRRLHRPRRSSSPRSNVDTSPSTAQNPTPHAPTT